MGNNFDKQYLDLLKDILENGQKKSDRTGTGTLSVFGRQISHKMSDGFPAVTTKKLHFKGVVSELLWFLNGRTDLRYLLEHNNFIWVGDAYKKYMTTINEIIEGYKSGDMLGSQPHIENMFSDSDNLIPLSEKEFIEKIKSDDEFDKCWGELGPVYGAGWRNWKYMGPKSQQEMLDENTNWPWKTIEIDQITNLIHELKTNPDSRRLMVSAWNVGELDQMTLPPCHYGFQVYTRELSYDERFRIAYKDLELRKVLEAESKMLHFPEGHNKLMNNANIPTRAISLMWNQRSVDTFLGLPFNIASYGLLLEIIAKQVNMIPDEVIGNLGDVHLYLNHIEPIKEQLTREPYPLPTVKISDRVVNDISEYTLGDFTLENYQSHPPIKAPLSN